MDTRGLSGARKNHYRSTCSMLYRVALLPENRSRTGVRENPFAGLLRDKVQRRTRVLTPAEISDWIAKAPAPVVAAVTIGALAPALRLRNVVDLQWKDFSAGREYVTLPHKADRETGLPLTIAVSAGLRSVLKELHAQRPKDPYVVPLDGERYWQLMKLLKRSIKSAKLPYGRRRADGVTFHTLRHSMNTWLARARVSASERQRSMAHATPAMQDWYTHFGATDTVRAMNLLGKMPIAKEAVARLKSLAVPAKGKVGRRTLSL